MDADTHDARKTAHAAFDPLWKSGRMTRSEAYRKLRRALRISERSCHMAGMKKEMALLVPQAVEKILAGLGTAT